MINLQMPHAYISTSDPATLSSTWQLVIDEMGLLKKNPVTRNRWISGTRQKAFDPIRDQRLIEIRPEQLQEVMRAGPVSTNIFLRRMHNFALDMGWLLAFVIPRRQWPKIKHGEKRAITFDEHKNNCGRSQS